MKASSFASSAADTAANAAEASNTVANVTSVRIDGAHVVVTSTEGRVVQSTDPPSKVVARYSSICTLKSAASMANAASHCVPPDAAMNEMVVVPVVVC